jgi:hypothetical protein
MWGWIGNRSFAASPVRAIIFRNPAVVAGALASNVSGQAKYCAAHRWLPVCRGCRPLPLYGVAIFAGAISGYGSGLEVQRARLPIYAMAVLVAAMILLTWLGRGAMSANDPKRTSS